MLTKLDILKLLESFEDHQSIFIRLHSSTHPDGFPVLVQRIEPAQLSPNGPHGIGLIAHNCNRDVDEEPKRKPVLMPCRSRRLKRDSISLHSRTG